MINEETKKIGGCAVTRTAELLGNVWIILIIKNLLTGPKRFNELQALLTKTKKDTPINAKTLTDKLRELADRGIVIRTSYNESPPKVEYSLTDVGFEFSEIIHLMREFGKKYIPKNDSDCKN